MIHDNFSFSQKREVNRTFEPLAHFVACTCASNRFLMNLKHFNKSMEAIRSARFREMRPTFLR